MAELPPDLLRVRALLVDETTHGRLVELLWLTFAQQYEVPRGGPEGDRMRRMFFAGASVLWLAQQLVMTEDREPTQEDFRRMSSINDELTRFLTTLASGAS